MQHVGDILCHNFLPVQEFHHFKSNKSTFCLLLRLIIKKMYPSKNNVLELVQKQKIVQSKTREFTDYFLAGPSDSCSLFVTVRFPNNKRKHHKVMTAVSVCVLLLAFIPYLDFKNMWPNST